MSSKIDTLRQDAAELQRLSNLTESRRIKDILSVEARKIETEISLLQEKENSIQPNSTQVTTTKRVYEVKITTYAWDQSNTSVKLFVTLPNVQDLPQDKITCNFTESSFDLLVKELDGKNYTLSIKNLFEKITPEQSSWKVKTGMVVITLSKRGSQNWTHLTKTEKKETKVPSLADADSSDPSSQLMNLMKQMYDDGDDEMKRTIAKAWTESREKNKNIEF